jgi:hypothetical protein
MNQSNDLVQKKSTFLDNLGNFCKKIASFYTGKHKYFFIVPSLLILTYIVYFIFVFSFNSATFGDYNFLKYPVVGICCLFACAIIGKVIYDICHHKLTAEKLLFAIFCLGIAMRLTYMVYTPIYYDNGTWRQHDLSYGRSAEETYAGHYGIIMWIFRNWTIPDMIRDTSGSVDFGISGQLYQPKLVHILYAVFMKINSIFVHFGDGLASFHYYQNGTIVTGTLDNITMNEYALFEMNRILACYVSCLTLLVCYNILKNLKISKNGLVIGTALVAFCPVFYMFSTSLNNDSFSIFFGFLAILYTLKWFKEPKFLNIMAIAIYLGLGMSCKLSIGVLAFFIAAMFIYKFIKVIGDNKKEHTVEDTNTKINLSIGKIIGQFALFAIIVFPLGLSYPIYAKIRFNQPFTYVWLISKYNWNYIDESVGFLNRFLIYPAGDFFMSFFVENRAWQNGAVYSGIQPNVWAYILKSSLFGEYTFNYGFSAVLYVFGFFVFALMIGLLIYNLIDVIKKKKVDINTLIFILGIGFVYFVSVIIFNIKYPFTCSMDFRYFVPFILVGGLLVGMSYDKLSLSTKKPAKLAQFAIIGLVTCYSLWSMIVYLA